MADNKPIYGFQSLKEFLKRKGYRVKEAGPYKKIEGQTLTQADVQNIEFREDGTLVYTAKNGVEHIGFIFKQDYYLGTYPEGPAMHTRRCSVIQDFIRSGSYRQHYRFAETSKVWVHDKSSYKEVQFENMRHCAYCQQIQQGEFSRVRGSADFERLVDNTPRYNHLRQSKENAEVDVLGYTRDWEQVSQKFRAAHDYTCDSCGLKIDIPFDRRYIQVHHINGTKTNNSEHNLRCLCVYCHAHVDDNHMKRLTKGANKVIYDKFVQKYGEREYHPKKPNSMADVWDIWADNPTSRKGYTADDLLA